MSDSKETPTRDRAQTLALVLGFLLVVIGLTNNIPAIPGLDDWAKALVGTPTFVIRKFPYEFMYPLVFVLMMTIVALHHSFLREYGKRSSFHKFAAFFMDMALIGMAVMVALSYLVEIEAVCLLDQFSGERAELIAKSLKEEQEFAKTLGLPIPNTVDDPQCLNTLEVWIFAIVGFAVTIFLLYDIKVWGLPLVLVALFIAAYTMITVMVWYFYGAEEINKYFVTKLSGEPRQLIDGRPKIQDILINNGQGLLGRFMDILLNTVFPYIVLGNLFGISAGGKSLIKIAFLWTRRLRGGPAHSAIVSSAMFGTISGGPIINVLSTGVLTIPMMLKRGFNQVFAGGVEAAASSGGQIMPPVMGVAAFVLASLTLVPYREVIIAATIPALAYFGCLFLSVVFQARKQGIEPVGAVSAGMQINRKEKIHLLMIFGPIFLILILLLTPKEAVGCGPLGWLFGIEPIVTETGCRATNLPWVFQLIQNSVGDAGSAGWWAVFLLMGLLFLDSEMRASPKKLVEALADAGVLASTLYLMFLAVSVIDFCLNFTGLSDFIARDILGGLRSLEVAKSQFGLFLFLALLVTMVIAIFLGMGMPTVPAYINVALLMGPMLTGLGIAIFTAHMFIFYFAVASAITPPIAIAAFAAASITKADPMATGFSAVRSGIVMFVIPFIFAFYPELLLIDAAILSPVSRAGQTFIEGYDGTLNLVALAWLCLRLVFSLYLLASGLAQFDRSALSWWETIVRVVVAVLVMLADPLFYGIGIVAGGLLLIWHHWRSQPAPAAT